MALKKSDLYSSLWKSCDELRGGMDASYKDYILTLLFMKYVSDKAKDPNSLIDVPKGGSFDTPSAWVRLTPIDGWRLSSAPSQAVTPGPPRGLT